MTDFNVPGNTVKQPLRVGVVGMGGRSTSFANYFTRNPGDGRIVALCDNESQGIVPVSRLLGNGDDPKNNLYWGAMYGTKTFLAKSKAWETVTTARNLNASVLERIILRHRSTGAYLVADAYRGSDIKKAVRSFLHAAAGDNPVVLRVRGDALGAYGKADLVAYVGRFVFVAG